MRTLWLTFAAFACGGDPILQRADELEAQEEVSKAPAVEVKSTDKKVDSEEVITPGIPDETITPGVPDEPDPVQPDEPEQGVPDEPTPAPPGTPGGSDTGGVDVTPGVPEEPEPAPPGTEGGAPHEGKVEALSGPQVTLRGRISMDESIKAKVYIDVFDGDQRNHTGPRPSLVKVIELAGAGDFEITLPVSAKRVWLSAYADLTSDNRPTKGEPTGWFPGNPVFLDSPPDFISVDLVMESKPVGLGLDFGR